MSQRPEKSSLTALTIAAVGIVYGDIGTSPLYTMRAIFGNVGNVAFTAENILGIVSLIIWGLIIIVSVKYVLIMLKADNRGEGGTLALMALAHTIFKKNSRLYFPLLVLGVFGASLFYGDSVITPAISVLSAVEGLEVATPILKPYVVPIALVILVGLYSVQSKGTAGIGKLFGPIMIFWFLLLGALGIVNIVAAPEILMAFNPWYALSFVTNNPFIAFIALSEVVLAFTGAETLYADMGHFGPQPIRRAWFRFVFPALVLNYMGQGGLLLSRPDALANPFFMQLGSWSIYPLVIFSTMAVIIASQATISGAFSITKQAIGLGLMPRMKIIHTSPSEFGQIYIPSINWMQMCAVILAVIGFGSSENLTAAYGLAVTGAMLITTIFLFFVMRYVWKLNLAVSIIVPVFFGITDALLFTSNSLKISHGGWFPLAIGFALFTVMMTWRRGRHLVGENQRMHAIPLDAFLKSLFFMPPHRVAGTAIFLRGEHDGTPQALLHNLSHNKVLHERVFFLTIHVEETPWIPPSERIQAEELGHNCYQLDFYYGFNDEADIPKTLELCKEYGYTFDMMTTSFFVSRQTIISNPLTGMARWREMLFIWIYRNARNPADFYRIPANRVIELGARVEI
ncbi:potassium transporter Kup [Oxalobacter vibrioformis]|uniref:Probable potassium transport system protein Kup n=1 Tax=Oxalobacter vibrioformis TaxID=933080 RepID=A0A9E9LV00_9BURK|nr:potassium transporter Kup [Oxalobacter vibrioformis]WAW10175.1 potassium transporter Kup [Oxalobacter vibrioformis]